MAARRGGRGAHLVGPSGAEGAGGDHSQGPAQRVGIHLCPPKRVLVSAPQRAQHLQAATHGASQVQTFALDRRCPTHERCRGLASGSPPATACSTLRSRCMPEQRAGVLPPGVKRLCAHAWHASAARRSQPQGRRLLAAEAKSLNPSLPCAKDQRTCCVKDSSQRQRFLTCKGSWGNLGLHV